MKRHRICEVKESAVDAAGGYHASIWTKPIGGVVPKGAAASSRAWQWADGL